MISTIGAVQVEKLTKFGIMGLENNSFSRVPLLLSMFTISIGPVNFPGIHGREGWSSACQLVTAFSG
jgi:hypothetical protein